MMDLNLIYSSKRTESYTPQSGAGSRSEFLRDFDRIIFSSPFRRLQNKTQVFPLPGSVFVHNRLTHSLEVASVGRTLGTNIGEFLAQKFSESLSPESKEFYNYSLYNVISSACLCHDIGNPAFGHSGEDAICRYFIKNQESLKHLFSDKEWADLTQFEGNANAIRILTQQQNGKSKGGLLLTYSTLASISKYPCEAIAKNKNYIHTKKFGFFQSEKSIFGDIAHSTQMQKLSNDPMIFQRHPFVWLVEAADDICYNIMDMEDAHRLGIIDHEKCLHVFLHLLNSIGKKEIDNIHVRIKGIQNKNDKIAYLRAKTIHHLTQHCIEIYKEHHNEILNGDMKKSLFKYVSQEHAAIREIQTFSEENIYQHASVIEIENAGYHVMYELLSHFITPIIIGEENRDNFEKKALKLIPNQYLYEGESVYNRVLGVLDFISGMTDNFATDLYKKIKGIDIGMSL